MAAQPHVLFLGSGYAGHRTRFSNLVEHSQHDGRINPSYRLVSGWRDDGVIERAGFVPRSMRGRIRAATEASNLLRVPRPDVVWTAALTAIRPWIPWYSGPMRRPLIIDRDCTSEARDAWSYVYWNRPPHRGTRRRVHEWLDKALADRVTFWTPWSQWAADSLLAAGIPEERVRVLPPGVDLTHWRAPEGGRPAPRERVRLLFVGGDFTRKGGEMLLDVLEAWGECGFELDIVTREAVRERPGVRVHRAEPNSPLLRCLYERADAFIMPSVAECFGIATVEAMASGLPVIVGDTGAGPEIVGPEAGWVIQPTREGIAEALRGAWALREDLPAMGAAARNRAETRFDGVANDRAVVDLVLEASEHGRR